MELYKVVNSLYSLESDINLNDEKDWDDTENTKKWLENVKSAINVAIRLLDNDNYEIGTMKLKGEDFIIKKSKQKILPPNYDDIRNAVKIFNNFVEDVGLEDSEQWLSKGFTEGWRLQTIECVGFVESFLNSVSFESICEINFANEQYIIYSKL